MTQLGPNVDEPALERDPQGRLGRPGLLLRVISNQKVAFLLVGGFNTFVGFCWFSLWVLLWGDPRGDVWRTTQFNTLGWACGVLTAFFAYRWFVFRVQGNLWRDFIRFVAVSLPAFVANTALLLLFTKVWHWPSIPAQLVVTILVVIPQFFGYKNFSFKR
ncbi:GtrA family protein [Micrococcales bacterium 31B]|nr:GtrA family protein [Micrococcales bacterium 31B]